MVCIGCAGTTGALISVAEGSTTSGINFSLTTGGRITGTLTNVSTGALVSGVSVSVYNSSGVFVKSAASNTSGVYTVSGLTGGSYFAVIGSATGFIGQLYQNKPCPSLSCFVTNGTPIGVTLGQTTSGINFALSTGARISGRVFDETTGTGIASATVQIFNSSGTSITSTTTDASGNYSVSGFPTGVYLAAVSNSAGYVNELFNDIQCMPGCAATSGTLIQATDGQTTTGIDFALRPGGRITGVVTDELTGAPLANVSVQAVAATGVGLTSATTGADGRFTVSGLFTGNYYLRTTNSLGYVNERSGGDVCLSTCTVTAGVAIAVVQGNTTSGADFALRPGARITGTVIDATTSLGVTNITVQVYDAAGILAASANPTSGGVYSVLGLPGGAYYARTNFGSAYAHELYQEQVCGTNCVVTTGTPIVLQDGQTLAGINFSLAQLGLLTGRISDAQTGAALTDAFVRVFNVAGTQAASAFTNVNNGTYSILLPAGTYFVQVTDTGYVGQNYDKTECFLALCPPTSGTAVTVVEAQSRTVDVALSRGRSLNVTVTDSLTSAPVVSAAVQLITAAGTFASSASTDATGRTTVSGLIDGTYYIRVMVTTVPRPVMVNTSSMGMRKGLSMSRWGSGTKLSTASMSSRILAVQASSPSSALSALTRTTGVSSPGNSYWVSSSRTSSSTRSSSSSSSTASALFRATTM